MRNEGAEIRVKYIGYDPLLSGISKVDGWIVLDPQNGSIKVYTEGAEKISAPLSTYSILDVIKVEPVIIKKKFRKSDQILNLFMQRESETFQISFSLKDITASHAAASLISFQNEFRTQQKLKHPSLDLGTTISMGLSTIADTVGKKVQEISKEIVETVEKSGKVLEGALSFMDKQFEGMEKELSSGLEEVVELSLKSANLPAILNALLAQGLFLASYEDFDTALAKIQEAIDSVPSFDQDTPHPQDDTAEFLSKAKMELIRVREQKERKKTGSKESEEEEEKIFKRETMRDAISYMEEAKKIVKSHEKE